MCPIDMVLTHIILPIGLHTANKAVYLQPDKTYELWQRL